MDNTIDALRNLYVALGGTASNVADLTIIPDMINAIAALITSGATAELPKVTSSDNGKVLTVVSGKWAKANLPS
jgi:dTDP-D-glucose 4,6-dehydratase